MALVHFPGQAWPEMKLRFAQIFDQKTRDEWVKSLAAYLHP